MQIRLAHLWVDFWVVLFWGRGVTRHLFLQSVLWFCLITSTIDVKRSFPFPSFTSEINFVTIFWRGGWYSGWFGGKLQTGELRYPTLIFWYLTLIFCIKNWCTVPENISWLNPDIFCNIKLAPWLSEECCALIKLVTEWKSSWHSGWQSRPKVMSPPLHSLQDHHYHNQVNDNHDHRHLHLSLHKNCRLIIWRQLVEVTQKWWSESDDRIQMTLLILKRKPQRFKRGLGHGLLKYLFSSSPLLFW